ncbi:MAG: glycosyltransferase [Armatimonadetes bacterium]|nr:glycosyltransferase [Armatimonadota bacterium]NIM24309.1 glycosyltransferase [Armatimonadota bacterium]NIM68178.1 glycosyltransferase [Armatimonadota bacterium]NIM76638.1 glycosyltransferase [Armatimonadota bacterium]NIN06383.1 glycosyltransferase [Armatimonadota bacterium]
MNTETEEKFCLVVMSSWPPRACGIASYSYDLLSEGIIPTLDTVFGEQQWRLEIICHTDGSEPIRGGRIHPILEAEKPGWPDRVMAEIRQIREENQGPLACHFQHEFGIYNSPADKNAWLFTKLLFDCKLERIPAVVTYHTLLVNMPTPHRIYYNHTLGLAAATIIHEGSQRLALPWNIGRVVWPKSVSVIQHGATTSRADREVNRERFGLSGKKVVGVIGWFSANKELVQVVTQVWPRVRAEMPEAVLVVAGDARAGDPGGTQYEADLLHAIAQSPERDSILHLPCNDPQRYHAILSTFDVFPLLYSDASQSGNLAHAYSAGVPVVVSALEGLKASLESSRAGVVVPIGDWEEAAREILRLLRDDGLRALLSQRGQEYVRRNIAWELTGRKHLDVYRWAIDRYQQEMVEAPSVI